MITKFNHFLIILALAVLATATTPFKAIALSLSYLGGTIEDIRGSLIKIDGRYYELNKNALIKKNENSKELAANQSSLQVGQSVNYRYAGSQIFYIYIVR